MFPESPGAPTNLKCPYEDAGLAPPPCCAKQFTHQNHGQRPRAGIGTCRTRCSRRSSTGISPHEDHRNATCRRRRMTARPTSAPCGLPVRPHGSRFAPGLLAPSIAANHRRGARSCRPTPWPTKTEYSIAFQAPSSTASCVRGGPMFIPCAVRRGATAPPYASVPWESPSGHARPSPK
jgi:hypothetical protein